MRLLVATDGSSPAQRAAALAARLARELREVEVVVVSVGHVPPILHALRDPDALMDVGALVEGLEHAGRGILDATMRTFDEAGVSARTVYRQGDPVEEIIKAADEADVDLIVIGSRGVGRLYSVILGSVSERVLQGTRRPVLVVR